MPVSEFASDVRAGLSKPQKEIPSKYFYDDVGTALFEVITHLPEYGLTRADERLLQSHAAEVAARLQDHAVVAELGSGNGSKTRWILQEVVRRQSSIYFPIDISSAALARCTSELSDIERLQVVPLECSYVDGLREVTRQRADGSQLLVLFLGSTIGNLDRPASAEFLRRVRDILRKDDGLYVSADLEKPVPQMLAAYNDSIGVTAAFNLNVLARINRELGGNFVLSAWRHVALYNEAERRIEMHLRSVVDQEVTIRAAALKVAFRAGETIRTENSHKFSAEEVVRTAQGAGYCCEAQWVDQEWPFAQSLLIAV